MADLNLLQLVVKLNNRPSGKAALSRLMSVVSSKGQPRSSYLVKMTSRFVYATLRHTFTINPNKAPHCYRNPFVSWAWNNTHPLLRINLQSEVGSKKRKPLRMVLANRRFVKLALKRFNRVSRNYRSCVTTSYKPRAFRLFKTAQFKKPFSGQQHF